MPYAQDFERKGYDGLFETNMTVCIESYIGAVDGRQGVKLEQLAVIKDHGAELLSAYPFDDRLL